MGQPAALPCWVGPAPQRTWGILLAELGPRCPFHSFCPHLSADTDRQPAGPLCLRWEAQPRDKEPSGGSGLLECLELSEQTTAT